MKKWIATILFVFGLLMMVQAAIFETVARHDGMAAFDEKASTDPKEFHSYIMMTQVSHSVANKFESVCGGLACWLLALYLKTKRLEREIREMHGQPIGEWRKRTESDRP